MVATSVCCQDLPGLVPVPSPFTKIIALGFFDGPTSGIARCQTCQRAWKFDMLDWDEQHAIRVVRLAELPANAWEPIVEAMTKSEPPRWPVWFPRWQWSSPEARADAERLIADTLAKAQPPTLLAAWTAYGDRVLAAKACPPRELASASDWLSRDESAPPPDWFAMLGLTRKTDKASA